jgi:hypothetical protein
MSANGQASSDADLFQLAYVSSAVTTFSDSELEELLKKSRRNNEASGLTGMLLYKDGNFMQFLEGPKNAVVESMSKIKADPRHHGVIVLLHEYKAERDFAEWSMGFRKLDNASDENLAGRSDFLDHPLTSEEFVSNPTRSLQLLRSFRKNMR